MAIIYFISVDTDNYHDNVKYLFISSLKLIFAPKWKLKKPDH